MPEVSFTKEYALEVVTNDGTSTSSSFYTTSPRYTEENFNTLSPPYFQFYTENENDDDNPEKFVFDISIKGITTANIRNLYLALAFNYKLDKRIEAEMVSLAFLKIDTPNGLGTAKAFGSLQLKELEPFKEDYTANLLYNVNPLDKVLNESLSDLYFSYATREQYTVYENRMVVQPYGETNQAVLHLEIYIPKQQEIVYNPSTLSSLKPAWIQYIAVLSLLYFILIEFVLKFVYSNQILETHISNNLPKEKDKRWFRKFDELFKS